MEAMFSTGDVQHRCLAMEAMFSTGGVQQWRCLAMEAMFSTGVQQWRCLAMEAMFSTGEGVQQWIEQWRCIAMEVVFSTGSKGECVQLRQLIFLQDQGLRELGVAQFNDRPHPWPLTLVNHNNKMVSSLETAQSLLPSETWDMMTMTTMKMMNLIGLEI